MNHVLDHDGYRFFQSSYDQDELGTVLSVNRDPGKIPTYVGYFLLGLGLFFNVVNPRSRFRKLAKKINEDAVKKVASFTLIACFAAFAPSKTYAVDNARNIDANHAKELSTLKIQSADGRMKPFDTVAREILNKIHRGDTLDGLNANQADPVALDEDGVGALNTLGVALPRRSGGDVLRAATSYAGCAAPCRPGSIHMLMKDYLKLLFFQIQICKFFS